MMRRWSAIFFVFAFLFLFQGAKAQAYTNLDVSLSFHDTLSPYGSWVNVSHYGNCWRPRVSGFVPFTNGYWIYTDYGPTWVGNEPYAWSVYHYGRWVFTPQFGWIWVPGYEWSPGRVRWAHGSNYIGWAPDYPGFDQNNVNLWVFIDRNHFGSRNYSNVILRRDNVRNLFARRDVRYYSGRLQRSELERITGRQVRVVRVKEREIVADRHRARLVVPEGHEEILQHVSDASKRHAEKQKIEVKQKSQEENQGDVKVKAKSDVKKKSESAEKEKSKKNQKSSKKPKAHSKPN